MRRRQQGGLSTTGSKGDTDLAQEIELRTEAGGNHQLVHHDRLATLGLAGGDAQPGTIAANVGEPKTGLDANLAGDDKGAEGCAKRAARRQLVVGTTAEGLFGLVATQQP